MIKMELLPQARPEKISFRGVIWYGTFVIDALFETILIITLLIEFFFVLEFGWLKVAPFLIISLLNICLWAYHVKHSRSIEA